MLMIRAKRIGRFKGVWRLVDEKRNAVSVALWFDRRRARRAAKRKRQTALDL